MATLEEMAEKLRLANPNNHPMYLDWMAKQLWPEAQWLKRRSTRHNGGARVGGVVAAGFAGKMAKRGLLKRPFHPEDRDSLSKWVWIAPAKEPK